MVSRDTHPSLASDPVAEAAIEAYLAGVAAVAPNVLVRRAVRQGHLDDWLGDREKPKMIHVLALGKAAPRMLWGLVEAGVPFKGLGVAPRGVPAPGVDTFRWLPGDHPVPGDASLAAGREVLEWARKFPRDEPLLGLLSGGASSCVEVPEAGLTFQELQHRWKEAIRSGLPIEEMNRHRSEWSALKGGKLGRLLLERTGQIRVWLIADTPLDVAPAAVGSGPFFQADAPDRIPHRVLAFTDDMVVAAGLRLGALGWTVYRHGRRIHGDVASEVEAFLAAAEGLPKDQAVALVGGGEPTVELPRDAPPGGRAQHAALLAARRLSETGSDALFLACASDGVDGSTDAAGAWVTGADWSVEAGRFLERFDAHPYLLGRGRLVTPGATGTNVNDLWVVLRR